MAGLLGATYTVDRQKKSRNRSEKTASRERMKKRPFSGRFCVFARIFLSAPSWTRTKNPLIKSQML